MPGANTDMITYADEIRLGKAITGLGLGPDDSVLDAITAIAAKIEEQQQQLHKELFPVATVMASTAIKHESSNGAGLGIQAQQLQQARFKVEVERGQEAATLQFDAGDWDLPQGAKITSTMIAVSGQAVNGETQILTTSKSALSKSIAYNRFPVTVDARVMVNTVDGDVELRRSVTVTAAAAKETQQPVFEVIDHTNTNASTDLSDIIHDIQSRVKYLETSKR